MHDQFLESITKQFQFYKSQAEKAMAQLEDKDLFWQYNEESNSIAIIVNHLWGNMKSRWTDFLTSDGEKEWRDRDLEFENVIGTREEMIQKWDEGWQCLFDALGSINETNFEQKVFIRNQSHSIIDAIHRQLAHYATHIGQIFYIAKMVKNDKWESLTIPRGKSSDFNQSKFSRGKHGGHFTDDLMKKN